jgi:diadenosine tetraphosphate (Ap4A) HIT family hydrolase
LLAALAVWCVVAATKAKAKGHLHVASRQTEKALLAKTESEQAIQNLTQKVATLEAALRQATQAVTPPVNNELS